MTRSVLGLCALALLALAAPSVAAGQSVVVLPRVLGDGHIAEDARARAVEAVTAALAAEGLQVRDAEIPAELEGCGDGPCVVELLRAADVDLAAGITLWASAETPLAIGELVVGLVNPDGHSFEGSARPDGADLSHAAAEAVHQARARLILGPGPFLLVDGEPFGASVFIDDEHVGGVPWNGRVEPGQHEVRVERRGYAAQTHTVQIPDDVTASERLQVELVPIGGGGSGGGIAGWAIPVGVGAIVAGVGVGAGVPAISAATTGCADADADCVTSNQLAIEPTVAWAVVGGVVAIGGLTLVIVAASEGSAEASVRARVGPTHLSFEGSF